MSNASEFCWFIFYQTKCRSSGQQGIFLHIDCAPFWDGASSTGTQPRQIFNHCVPKEKRAAMSCLHFFALCLAYHSILPPSLSCRPLCPTLCPVPQLITPFALSCSALCPVLSNVLPFVLSCAFLSCHVLTPACTALPCPAMSCRGSAPAFAPVLPMTLPCPCPYPALSCPALNALMPLPLPLSLPLPCPALR